MLSETAGFVDAHSHLRSTSLASHGIDNCANLEEALLRFTAMSSVDAFDDAFVAASDLVRAGVTGVQVFFHTFARPDEYLETLSAVVKGIEKSGIRALIILGITDQAEFLPLRLVGEDLLPPWLPPKSNLSGNEYVEIFHKAKNLFPSARFGLGPIAGQWCSDNLLAQLGEIAAGERIHAHLLESPRQRDWAGENPLSRLQRFGLLTPNTSLAHGVWCEDDDLKEIADTGAQLVTCPGSNKVLRAGKANLPNWQKHGVEFGFGMDSAAEDIKPLKIATEVMDEQTAMKALTLGGKACTDLPTDQDRVSWSNLQEGTCEEVTIGGKVLVKGGRLLSHDEVEAARERITETMLRDSDMRTSRQQQVTELLPRYQQALGS